MAENPSDTEDLLHAVARGHDRDAARFFVGRKSEIKAFGDAVADSKDFRQTQFRIFQGAPGCGKTSLLTHLHENAPPNRVFVALTDDGALASTAGLARCIDDAVASEPAKWAAALGPVFRTVGKLGNFFMPGSAVAGEGAAGATEAAAAAWFNEESAKRLRSLELVMVCDEAQTLNKSHAAVLRMLHTAGVKGGIPSVLALAGLSHTGNVVRSLEGMSRLSQNADVIMGIMAEEECVESTRMMLARCRIPGTADQHEATAKRVGAMAQRWPQHLACAHAALARELIRTGRDLGKVDIAVVGRDTTEARYNYYKGRLQGYPVLEDAGFVARVVAAIYAQNAAAEKAKAATKDPDLAEPKHVTGVAQVARLCRLAVEAEPADSSIRELDIKPIEIANRMIEKGIISHGGIDGPYAATISSMATWLGERIPRNDPLRRSLIPGSGNGDSQGDGAFDL